MIRPLSGVFAAAALLLAHAPTTQAIDFPTFETGPVRPVASSDDGSQLYSLNIPDNRLEIFDVTDRGLIVVASVQVGLEPCSADSGLREP